MNHNVPQKLKSAKPPRKAQIANVTFQGLFKGRDKKLSKLSDTECLFFQVSQSVRHWSYVHTQTHTHAHTFDKLKLLNIIERSSFKHSGSFLIQHVLDFSNSEWALQSWTDKTKEVTNLRGWEPVSFHITRVFFAFSGEDSSIVA